MAKTQKLNLIQTCRGFAAISVLLLHLTSKLYDKYTPGYKFLNGFFMHGGSGVDFFFVLSGFIIFYSQFKNILNTTITKKRKTIDFLQTRFTRVYPIYWIVMFIYLIGFIFFPSIGTGNEAKLFTVLKSVFLFPQQYPTVSVSWTLTYEIFFYLMFSLILLLSSNIAIPIFIFWILGCTINIFGILNHITCFRLKFYL